MNEDYLWDKSGEPDPEIEHLERVLGTLRYQPRSFEVPKASRTGSRRTLLPLVAIAASIAIAILAAGLWLSLNRPMTAEIARIELPPEAPAKPITGKDPTANNEVVSQQKVATTRRAIVRRRESSEMWLAERKEAEAAKQQLLLALRLTSSKLSIAQKKVQGTPGIIRNQHKVG
jgi:hypothetical protein